MYHCTLSYTVQNQTTSLGVGAGLEAVLEPGDALTAGAGDAGVCSEDMMAVETSDAVDCRHVQVTHHVNQYAELVFILVIYIGVLL